MKGLRVGVRQQICATFGLAVMLAGVACGTQSTPAGQTGDLKSVHFTLGEFPIATMTWEAIEAGSYSNLSMGTTDLNSGGSAIQFIGAGVTQGSADLSEPPLAIAYNSGVKIKVVWSTGYIPDYLIVKPGITDLRGKKLSAPGGSVTQYHMERYLESQGLTINDVKFIDLGGEAALSAFKTGAIDGAMTYPPYSVEFTKAGGVTLNTGKEFSWDIFSQDFINAHPAVVQAFVCDTAKATDTFLANPAPGFALLSKKLGISVSDLQGVMPIDSIVPTSQMLTADNLGTTTVKPAMASSISDIASWMKDHKRVTNAPSADQAAQLIDSSFAQNAISGKCG